MLPKFVVTEDIPFGLFVLKLFWNSLNLFFVYQLIQFVYRTFQPPQNKKGFWFWLVFALITYRWIFLNILYGQMTILIVWGVIRAFEGRIENAFKRLAGLSFGVTLKILPIFMVGQLFLMKNWRAFSVAVLLCILMVLLPYVYLPFNYHNEILRGWLANINPFSKNHIVELGEGGFIDMGALITKYLTGLNVEGEARIDWFSMGERGVFVTTQIFRLLVLGSCWYWLVRFKNGRIQHANLWVMAIFLASIPLAFPHQRDYSLFMMWPMAILILNDCILGDRFVSKSILFGLFIGAILMGAIVFFEALPFEWRKNISGYRIQGLGGLVFLVFSHFYLNRKCDPRFTRH